MVKTPTESLNLGDMWDFAKVEYLPFAEWMTDDDENVCCIIEFSSNTPDKYENKWKREQWKIEIKQYDEKRILSGGKRLFAAIRSFCNERGKMPMDLGKVRIDRLGDGFETDYKVSIPKTPSQKADKK